MKPYARIQTNHSTIAVRFERIGAPSRFDCVLDLFRKSFPLAIWDQYTRSWILPISQLGTLIKFCKSLGYAYVQTDNTTRAQTSQQPNLPF